MPKQNSKKKRIFSEAFSNIENKSLNNKRLKNEESLQKNLMEKIEKMIDIKLENT